MATPAWRASAAPAASHHRGLSAFSRRRSGRFLDSQQMLERANYAFIERQEVGRSQDLQRSDRRQKGCKKLVLVLWWVARWRTSRCSWCAPPAPAAVVRQSGCAAGRDAINMRRKKQPACPTQSYKKCQHSGIKVLIPIFSNFNPQPLYQVKGKCYFSKQPTSQFAGGCVAFVCFWAQTDAEKIFVQGYS